MTEIETERLRERAEELFRAKKYAELKEYLSEMLPQDTAAALSEMTPAEGAAIFRLMKKDAAAETFVYLDPEKQETLILAFTDGELKPLLEELYVDDMVDIIEEMPAVAVNKILKNANREQRIAVNEILRYPKDSAGSIMTTEYVNFKADMTVGECFERLRSTGSDKESVYTCYVTDTKRHLLGVVEVKEMLFNPDTARICDIMSENVITVFTNDDKEKVANLFDKYDHLAIPVIDAEKRLVGIITVDDAMDVMREENTEDFEKMAAISPSDKGYFEIGVFAHAKNRILWLLVLMVSATFTGSIISNYETAFAAFPVLVAMIPMLMDTGGNCGSQASTMVIRGLALGEMNPADFFRVWFKEVRIALIVGVALAAVNFGRVYLFYGNSESPSPFMLAVITGITLVAEIVLAKSLGCLLPMLAKKLHLDPAIMASPLITTMVDAASVLLFFNVACGMLDIAV